MKEEMFKNKIFILFKGKKINIISFKSLNAFFVYSYVHEKLNCNET